MIGQAAAAAAATELALLPRAKKEMLGEVGLEEEKFALD